MKKLSSFVLTGLLMISLLLSFTGCGKSLNGDYTLAYACENGDYESFTDIVGVEDGESMAFDLQIKGDNAKIVIEGTVDGEEGSIELLYQLEETTDYEGNTLWQLTNGEAGDVTGAAATEDLDVEDMEESAEQFDGCYLGLDTTSDNATVKLYSDMDGITNNTYLLFVEA